jgi:TolA-binding protein
MKTRQRILVLMAVVATVVASTGSLFADDTNAAPAATVDDKINRLEQEIQDLKQQRELDQQQAQQQAQHAAVQAAQQAKRRVQLSAPGRRASVSVSGQQLRGANRWVRAGGREVLSSRRGRRMESTRFSCGEFVRFSRVRSIMISIFAS